MFQFIFAINVRLIKFRIKPKENGNGKQKFFRAWEQVEGGSGFTAKMRDKISLKVKNVSWLKSKTFFKKLLRTLELRIHTYICN